MNHAVARALSNFAANIAASDGAHEPLLFAQAACLFVLERERRDRVQRWIDDRAFVQAAIALHRHALPAYGFQLGELPVGCARDRGLASTWRRGEHRALPFAAATPALALLRATASAAAGAAEARAQADCTICGGLGWTVTAESRKAICRHGAR